MKKKMKELLEIFCLILEHLVENKILGIMFCDISMMIHLYNILCRYCKQYFNFNIHSCQFIISKYANIFLHSIQD